MINTMLGFKKNMTSSYDQRGRRVGATVVELGPNFVTQINTSSVQIGFGNKKSVKKPQKGFFQKVGVPENLRFLRETKVEDVSGVETGKEVRLEQIFKVGDVVKVTGTSKGKGFQGGVRRHGFAGGPKTHGQSDRHRAPGSIGAGTTPGRVYKGKRMAGHMGVDTVSLKNLEVLSIDRANNLIILKGGIPGPMGGLLKVERTGVVKGYTPPPEEKPEEEEEQEAKAGDQAETVESGEAKDEAQEQASEQVAEAIESAPVEEGETK